ncbi:sigma-70 family RNA polymerase sigma factor [Enterovibrio norvegicus]|uniref:RNA polymerase sigma factor n=1 Tax=Enterovibrio norvegicus TaxID=188144 RepID=A0A2N7L989_9GAMM|nr:sigma-70 family RNA polymerase sigma factor [Enterovibrio norvegicus]PMN90874.1 hypothetical protein BCT23_19350 [Enterovibrio norvegicus]
MPETFKRELIEAFTPLQQTIKGYLASKISNADQVDDLLQDVFLKAWKQADAVPEIQSFQAWLLSIARNTVIDFYRTRKLDNVELHENIVEELDETLALHQQLGNCMLPFINDLPEQYSDALREADIHDVKLATLAEREGVSLSAIKSRVARGRKLLHKKVIACCDVTFAGGVVSDYGCKGDCN